LWSPSPPRLASARRPSALNTSGIAGTPGITDRQPTPRAPARSTSAARSAREQADHHAKLAEQHAREAEEARREGGEAAQKKQRAAASASFHDDKADEHENKLP
jgi:hypothetical protein